ncbi:hypothetical protein JCM3770_006821 [Rhodotorula araucariae]
MLRTELSAFLLSPSSVPSLGLALATLAPHFRSFEDWKSSASLRYNGKLKRERDLEGDWRKRPCTTTNPPPKPQHPPDTDTHAVLYTAGDVDPASSRDTSPADLFEGVSENISPPTSPSTSVAAFSPAGPAPPEPSPEPHGTGERMSAPANDVSNEATAGFEFDLPFQLPQPSATTNRFDPLPVDPLDDEEDDALPFQLPPQLPPHLTTSAPSEEAAAPPLPPRTEPAPEAAPPKPVAQSRKRRNVAAYQPKPSDEAPAPNLASTLEKAKSGTLFKHRARAKGPVDFADVVVTVDDGAECNVADGAWFASWAESLALELRPAPDAAGIRLANNAIQRLVGFTTIRVQAGMTEELVDFRILDSGGAFQLLLGKPWKAQIGAVHFYRIDCILHETSVPGRWSRLWNENPKSAPEFTAVPHHPADLVEVLARLPPDQEANPAVLFLQSALGRHGPLTQLETACLTPIPDDDGLLCLDGALPGALRASPSVLASTDPASMAAALRKEAWRRELTLHPRATISPASAGPAFLSEQEVIRVIHYLEKEDATSEFWRSVEPQASDEWERWATPSLPEVDPAWLEPLPSEAEALPILRAYMKEVQEGEDDCRTARAEDPLAERRAEVRKVVQIGDDNSVLSSAEREQVEALLDEFTDQFAFSLEDVKATDTVRMRIPTPGAVPTRARHHPTNNPEQKAFLYEQIDKLVAAGVVVQVHYDEVSWVSHNKVAPKKDLSVQPKSRDELLRALEESIARVRVRVRVRL